MAGAVEIAVTAAPPSRPPGLSDADDMNELLVRVATSKDREAFARLYGFFAPRVKGYLMRVGSSADVAEDLAQETMMKVWRKARLFDPSKAAASTWIYTIARNLRIDALRRLSKANLDADDPTMLPEEEPRPDDNVERSERDETIRRAFATLPPNQHAVVTMHFYEDEPHSVIAERLNLPLGTVKSRLRLAFQKIRRELEDQ